MVDNTTAGPPLVMVAIMHHSDSIQVVELNAPEGKPAVIAPLDKPADVLIPV